jgi:hypothetical protein
VIIRDLDIEGVTVFMRRKGTPTFSVRSGNANAAGKVSG